MLFMSVLCWTVKWHVGKSNVWMKLPLQRRCVRFPSSVFELSLFRAAARECHRFLSVQKIWWTRCQDVFHCGAGDTAVRKVDGSASVLTSHPACPRPLYFMRTQRYLNCSAPKKSVGHCDAKSALWCWLHLLMTDLNWKWTTHNMLQANDDPLFRNIEMIVAFCAFLIPFFTPLNVIIWNIYCISEWCYNVDVYWFFLLQLLVNCRTCRIVEYFMKYKYLVKLHFTIYVLFGLI